MRPTDRLPQIVANLPMQPLKRLCYRIVDFAVLTTFDPMMPLYTLGPGKNGQRYTPKNGPNALYVSEDPITAQAEYFGVARAVLTADPSFQLKADPTVQLTIEVNLNRVLDLTDLTIQQAIGTTNAELIGPWRKQMIKGFVCPTQNLATVVFDSARFQAMRYTSARSLDHANLIIWEERLQLPSFVEVKDNSGTLSAKIPLK